MNEKALAIRDAVLNLLGKRSVKAIVEGDVNEEIVTTSDLVALCLAHEQALEQGEKIKSSLTNQVALSPVAPMKKEGNLFVSSLRPPDCAATRIGEIFPKNVKVVATPNNIPAKRLNEE